MSVDRTMAPAIHKIKTVDLKAPERVSDEHPFFWSKDHQMEATKVELIFKAGTKYQAQKLSAKLCADLLLSGSEDKSANDIAAAMDQLGGFVRVEPSKDFLSIQFYGMTQHIQKIVAIGLTAINEAIFPEHEWKEQLNIAQSAFRQATEKVSVLSRRAFYKKMYAGTPYDTVAELKDFDHVQHQDITSFHEQNIKGKAPSVFVSGGYSKDLYEYLVNYLNCFENTFEQPQLKTTVPASRPFEVVQVEKEGAIQNALRLGRTMWSYNHKDRIPFSVLNTVLGGYFGSRLMMNIREDKGFTYGIGSFYLSHQDFGIWGIATEVGSEYAKLTFQEIEREVNRLRDELVPEEELERVKNYMVGQFLSNTDGTFAVMEQFKSFWLRDTSFDALDQWLKIVQGITADEVQQLAQKYLSIENLTLVNAGQFTTFR